MTRITHRDERSVRRFAHGRKARRAYELSCIAVNQRQRRHYLERASFHAQEALALETERLESLSRVKDLIAQKDWVGLHVHHAGISWVPVVCT